MDKILSGPKSCLSKQKQQNNLFLIQFEEFFVDNDAISSHCTEIVLDQDVPMERNKNLDPEVFWVFCSVLLLVFQTGACISLELTVHQRKFYFSKAVLNGKDGVTLYFVFGFCGLISCKHQRGSDLRVEFSLGANFCRLYFWLGKLIGCERFWSVRSGG